MDARLLSLDRREARAALGALAAAGATFGTISLLAPGLASRLLGQPPKPRALWGLRLFGVRELMLAFALYRAYERDTGGRALLASEMLAISQAGDIAVAAAMLARGTISRRAGVGILLGAPPTLLAALAIRKAYSGEE
jgi:hypothetical protein